jgi:ADP-L-glycero-D-manno-heptose 6-epimerase
VIVVTGGAGFIGSNLVRGLNRSGHTDILVVDDLSDGWKFRNIADAAIADYLDREVFRDMLEKGDAALDGVRAVFHQGACTDTTEWDGRLMMDNNYDYSKLLLAWCTGRRLPFIYASSGAVYGIGDAFDEDGGHERPVNVYGWSKYLFDEYVRRGRPGFASQVAGLRYFNVYGPGEGHKGPMASVVHHFNRQLLEDGEVRLFKGSGGYADGEQRRDFIHVDDVVKVNLWLLSQPSVSGIFNVGTGQSRSFNEVATAVLAWHGRGRIRYIDFPEALRESYQSYTQADITALRRAGFDAGFLSLEEGIGLYLDWLNRKECTSSIP